MLAFLRVAKNRKGQGLVEYGLLIVLIAVVSITILSILGGSGESDSGGLKGSFGRIESSVAGANAGCWVAAEIFGGWYQPETIAARYYVNHEAPRWFKDVYLAHGEDFAKTLRNHPELKPLVRPLFEYFASQGAKSINHNFEAGF